MKALRDAAGADPTIMERVPSALGSEKKKDQVPPPVNKLGPKETPNPLLDNLKNQIAQKEPEKSFWEKVLGPDYKQKFASLSEVGDQKAYGEAMRAYKKVDTENLGKDRRAEATARTAQWSKNMDIQMQTEAALLKVETELAKSGLTGSSPAKDALEDRIRELKSKLVQLRKLTGYSTGSAPTVASAGATITRTG